MREGSGGEIWGARRIKGFELSACIMKGTKLDGDLDRSGDVA